MPSGPELEKDKSGGIQCKGWIGKQLRKLQGEAAVGTD